jgi:hypothetical protein
MMTENKSIKVAFVVATKVQYALTTYRPIIKMLRQDPNIQTLAMSVGKQPLSNADVEALDELFDVTLHNPFNNNWRLSSSWNPIAKLKPFQLVRLGITLRKTRAAFSAFWRENEPDVIVLQSDRQTPSFDVVRLAKKHGIPTLLIQGAVSSKYLSYRPIISLYNRIAKVLLGYSSGYQLEGRAGCDRVAVWGENGARYYDRVGFSRQNIDIVGSPRLDAYVTELTESDNKSTLQKLGLPQGSSYVLLATSPLDSIANPDENIAAIRSVIETAIEIAKNDKEFRLVLKAHPAELESFRQNGIDDLCNSSPALVLAENLHISEALAACDRAMVFYSTVALEAALAGKPCIAFNPFNWNFGSEYSRKGMVTELTSQHQIADFFTTEINNLEVGDPSYFITNIGNAARSVTATIHTMAGV